MGAVFDQLNRGEAVTSGLRKVDKSEMTHKNPSLRAGAVVPERQGSSDGINRSRSPAPQTKPKPDSIRGKGLAAPPTPKKEGKKELDGNKWIIVCLIFQFDPARSRLTRSRKTLKTLKRLSRLKSPSLSPSSFPVARTRLSDSSERQTLSASTTVPGLTSSSTPLSLPSMSSSHQTLLCKFSSRCLPSCWIRLMALPFI